MTWRERIVAARERGGFTEEEKDLAADARTCAVGQISPLIGHDHNSFVNLRLQGESEDEFGDAYALSGRFTSAVEKDDFNRADATLDAIEDRVLQLKREAQP